MTIIRRPTPLGELISLRSAMDRLFDDPFGRPRSGWLTAAPSVAVDIRSTADSVVVQTEPQPEAEAAVESGTGQGS